MSDANYARFNKRLNDIEARHRKLSSGYVRLEERNGLLVPVERMRLRRGVPMRGIVLAIGAFLLFKAFLFAQLGGAVYMDRVAQLDAGTVVERMGGWVMQADPATIWIAAQIAPLF